MSTLYIFDFDDTLVDSEAEVRVTHSNGSMTSMSSEEYAKYTEQEGDSFDFTDFDSYPKNAEIIEPVFDQFRDAINKVGLQNVVILTARSNSEPVRLFLKNNKIPPISIVAVGSADPRSKAVYILDRVKQMEHDEVVVFEDNARNIRTIRSSLTDSGIKLTTNRVSNGNIVDIQTEAHLRALLREIL